MLPIAPAIESAVSWYDATAILLVYGLMVYFPIPHIGCRTDVAVLRADRFPIPPGATLTTNLIAAVL